MPDQVPFVDLIAQHRPLERELTEAFQRAVRAAHFVGGPEVTEFEKEFAEYCVARWCVGVNSGTDALRFAYMALGIRPGDEVITVAHTFIATTEALTQAGASVRFVDVDANTMTMDPAAVDAAVTSRTVGVVPVHLYGQPADLDPLQALATRHGLWLVEDAAQAHGARYRGKRVGAFGSLSAFSFYPGKNLGSLGEGGAITGNGDDARRFVTQLREHGQSAKYVHEIEGYNGRLHALQAAFLRIKLRHLDEWNTSRRRVAAWYHERLREVAEIRLPVEAEYAEHVFHLYVVRTDRRDALQKQLGEEGIGSGLHYPMPLHLQRPYRTLGMTEGSLPHTEEAARKGLSLPMFPDMTESQVDRVATTIRRFFGTR